jgi:hypothetical protein
MVVLKVRTERAGAAPRRRARVRRLLPRPHRRPHPGENDAGLAQKLGQLQPFLAVFPRECVGQLASFGPT